MTQQVIESGPILSAGHLMPLWEFNFLTLKIMDQKNNIMVDGLAISVVLHIRWENSASHSMRYLLS